MEITLEKIELVKDRTGVSYKDAKLALEEADGNVVDAIISIEEAINMSTQSKVGEQGAEVIDKAKELVKKGNITKIMVKKGDSIILNLPVSVSIVGTVLAPWAALAGVIAAFGTQCAIHLVKDDGDIIDLSEMAKDNFGDVYDNVADKAVDLKEKGSDVFETVKEKTQDAINKVKKDDFDLDDEPCACGTEKECDPGCVCGDPDINEDATSDVKDAVKEALDEAKKTEEEN